MMTREQPTKSARKYLKFGPVPSRQIPGVLSIVQLHRWEPGMSPGESTDGESPDRLIAALAGSSKTVDCELARVHEIGAAKRELAHAEMRIARAAAASRMAAAKQAALEELCKATYAAEEPTIPIEMRRSIAQLERSCVELQPLLLQRPSSAKPLPPLRSPPPQAHTTVNAFTSPRTADAALPAPPRSAKSRSNRSKGKAPCTRPPSHPACLGKVTQRPAPQRAGSAAIAVGQSTPPCFKRMAQQRVSCSSVERRERSQRLQYELGHGEIVERREVHVHPRELNWRPCVSWSRTRGHASAGVEPKAVRQLASNQRPRVSWSRTGGHAPTGIELEAMRQLESNRRPCVSWSRTGGHASAGVEPEAVRQLESNWRPCVSWRRTGGRASAGIEPEAVRQLERGWRPAGAGLEASFEQE